MADLTDEEKKAARDAQKKELKDLIKEGLKEFADENSSKQRTTGQTVDDGKKSNSVFSFLFDN